MKPHKHRDLIVAWADGAEIEARYLKADGWTEWKKEEGGFIWYVSGAEYRAIPKLDIVKYIMADVDDDEYIVTSEQWGSDNLKLTFDGETGELKSAEVIK